MKQKTNYHGLVIAQGFQDPTFPESFSVFAKRISKPEGWIIYGIKIPSTDIDLAIQRIQRQLVSDEPWYTHLYKDEELIVIFKEKIFRVTSHRSTWNPILEYGKTCGIPVEQLDFWPNRFQDEIHYFTPNDFLK